MRLEFLEEAQAELNDSAAYIAAESSPETALRFVDDVERATRRILRWPTLLHPERDGTRRMLLGTFSFKVVYVVEGETIIVLAIAHTSRMPGYWKTRRQSRP
ncbi:MAG: type II toxin-antitoxin system RelE/ParE family toxin [Opitutaceae bacterium]